MLNISSFYAKVDYREKAAAACLIPSNFLRRELGPNEREVLVSRCIGKP